MKIKDVLDLLDFYLDSNIFSIDTKQLLFFNLINNL